MKRGIRRNVRRFLLINIDFINQQRNQRRPDPRSRLPHHSPAVAAPFLPASLAPRRWGSLVPSCASTQPRSPCPDRPRTSRCFQPPSPDSASQGGRSGGHSSPALRSFRQAGRRRKSSSLIFVYSIDNLKRRPEGMKNEQVTINVTHGVFLWF